MTQTTVHVRQTPTDVMRLLNTIGAGSKFKFTTKRQNEGMGTPAIQLEVAQGIVQGWTQVGQWPDAVFEIRRDGELV